jgi:protein TonB
MKAAGRIALGILFASTFAFGQQSPIRVGGNVQQANLTHQVAPVYPADAKRDRIQGTVKLEVTIDSDGHVQSVSVLEGPQELVQSAVDAVSQWTYKPTLLNGQPVNVITTVDVNYTLSQ